MAARAAAVRSPTARAASTWRAAACTCSAVTAAMRAGQASTSPTALAARSGHEPNTRAAPPSESRAKIASASSRPRVRVSSASVTPSASMRAISRVHRAPRARPCRSPGAGWRRRGRWRCRGRCRDRSSRRRRRARLDHDAAEQPAGAAAAQDLGQQLQRVGVLAARPRRSSGPGRSASGSAAARARGAATTPALGMLRRLGQAVARRHRARRDLAVGRARPAAVARPRVTSPATTRTALLGAYHWR